MQPGVEPLRRVGRRDLERQHGDELVVEGAGVRFGIEVAGLPAPVGPGAGEAVEDLLGRALAAGRTCVVGVGGVRVGLAPPQPLGHVGLGHRPAPGRDAGLAEVFLGEDIAGDLRPAGRDLDILLREHHRAVGVADLARGRAVRDLLARRSVVRRIVALDAHGLPPKNWPKPKNNAATTSTTYSSSRRQYRNLWYEMPSVVGLSTTILLQFAGPCSASPTLRTAGRRASRSL